MNVMPAPLGGIGQQVADNLFELGKSSMKSVVKAGSDLAQTSIEQIMGAPSGVGAPAQDKPKEQIKAEEERKKAESKQKDAQQYNRVKSELEQYRQRKQQLDQQIENEKAQENRIKEQKEGQEKQKKESFIQKLLHKAAGGSHGETDRQKE